MEQEKRTNEKETALEELRKKRNAIDKEIKSIEQSMKGNLRPSFEKTWIDYILYKIGLARLTEVNFISSCLKIAEDKHLAEKNNLIKEIYNLRQSKESAERLSRDKDNIYRKWCGIKERYHKMEKVLKDKNIEVK